MKPYSELSPGSRRYYLRDLLQRIDMTYDTIDAHIEDFENDEEAFATLQACRTPCR